MNNQGGRPRSGPGGATGVLHVIGGNDRGKQYLMVNPTTQIGRGADQDFVLADIAVSRRHVQILIEGARYRLRDLGSGNGTLINGVRTATALLNDGDQVEIGNTLLRFDHPPSSARATGMGPAAAPPAAAMPQAGAQARTMIAEAPQLPAPVYAPPTPVAPAPPPMAPPPAYEPQHSAYAQPGGTSLAMPAPQMAAPPQARGGGGMDTKKLAIFGGIGLVVLAGGGVGAMKLLGGGNKDKADKIYVEATKSFSSGDYDGAKKLFQQAMQLDPTSKLYPKQFKQCDVEIHAKAALKTAAGLAADKRWEEEFKTLDSIDKSAVAYEDAEKLRKQAIPAAVAQYLGEAKELMQNDTEGARTKIEAAIALDPDSAEAKDLAEKLRGATAVAAAPTDKPARTPRHADPSPKPAARPTTPPPAGKPVAATKPGKPAPEEEDDAGASGGFDLLASKGGAPYKAKDFNGAATQVRNQAKTLKGAAQQKALSVATQVQKLGELYVKAESDKAKNPVAAVNEYQQAAAIDALYGKGTHGQYFKGQAGKLAKDAAKQAYTKQDFPTAFEMSKIAARLGDDGGVGAQLKQKAKEINASAQTMAKSNPNGAKSLWRTVLRMVPPGDPSYVAAQKGLSTATTPAKDEDED